MSAQDHPPQGRGDRDLHESEAQAKAGIEAESLQPSACSQHPRSAWAGCGQTEDGMARIAVDIPRDRRIGCASGHLWLGSRRRRGRSCSASVSGYPGARSHRGRGQPHPRDHQPRVQVEGDLRLEVNLNIKRLMEIGCYRGLRHRPNLPVHGQRTRTNARMRKGPRRTVAGGKGSNEVTEGEQWRSEGEARGGAAT